MKHFLTTFALLSTFCISCATPYDAARKSVAAAEQVALSGEDAFGPWDLQHQRELVQRARAAGKDPAPDLAAYRKARARVVEGLKALSQAAKTAEDAINIAEQWGLSTSTLTDLIATVIDALGTLKAAAAAAGYSIPGLMALAALAGGA